MDAMQQRAREVFMEVMDLPRDARPSALDRLCGSDDALRHEVEQLLRSFQRAGGFMEGPTADVPGSAPTLAPAERPGTRIGPYKLLQLIGEGGFGSVFMAEQDHPVKRRVAIKVIKLGMDTRQVIARFEAERQALALMDHPHIARVLDAGATDTGRPYFVMDLCTGDSIVEYCDKNNLSIRDRLDLFAQVCQAVQHAHTKGVIHRDIKPSNVLVSTQDGRPHAKVIDFGIAKATASRLTEKTLFTEHRALIGTPEYMSPEQAEGSLDIDTRTDVYSLGVLLYELLTGTTPFNAKDLRAAAYAEIQRIIREVEPPKPSTRLSHTDNLGRVAAHRHTEPRKLGTMVCGDLDWIVMKALEKDRSRRYETANGLAMDVRRHLGGDPVLAAPPGRAYRMRKFVRRHRVGLTAVAVVAGTLLLGAVGTAWGWINAAAALREVKREQAFRAETDAIEVKFGEGVFLAENSDGRGVDIMQDASKRFTDHLGPGHRRSLSAAAHVADMLVRFQRPAEGLALYLGNLKDRQLHLGDCDPWTIGIRQSVAWAAWEAGERELSTRMLVEGAADAQRCLPMGDETRYSITWACARRMLDLGRVEEARTLMEDSVQCILADPAPRAGLLEEARQFAERIAQSPGTSAATTSGR